MSLQQDLDPVVFFVFGASATSEAVHDKLRGFDLTCRIPVCGEFPFIVMSLCLKLF